MCHCVAQGGKHPVTVKVHKRTRPRSRPNWLGFIASDRRFRLSRELDEELREIAELELRPRKAKDMLFLITEELSQFRSAEAVLDHHQPRPTHKRQLLEPLLKRARKDPPESWIEEAEALTCWGGPLAWEFQLEKFPKTADEDFFEKEWVKFADAILVKLCVKESRHGPTQKAKHRLINNLAFIFDAYSEPEHEEDCSTLRTEFVATALTAVGIQKADPEKLLHKSASRLTRELPEPFTPAMARRRARLYKRIVTAAEAKGQSVEAFLTENRTYYAEYRKAGPQIKKS
jgi:hypothetical protein